MTGIPIQLIGLGGRPIGRLRQGAAGIIAEAERVAKDRNLTKSRALRVVLHEYLSAAGFSVHDGDLAMAIQSLEAVRRGDPQVSIEVLVSGSNGKHPIGVPNGQEAQQVIGHQHPMNAQSHSLPITFFELEREYPDEVAHALFERLVGLDDHKERLLIELEMLLFPEQIEVWSRKHHHKVLRLCELQRSRVPLVLLEGDVGTGKTVLAETVGDALARRIGPTSHVHLLKINTQIRGTGQVGEMSDLIVQAFSQAEFHARSLNGQPVLLLLDEADALAASRDNHQMHHEDKAGLNTILQRLDNLRLTRLPIAVLFITNRPHALDPAIRRRAALVLTFTRPDNEVRAEIIRTSVPELTLKAQEVAEIVRLTGEFEPKNQGTRFTASDLTDRLLAGALRNAFSQRRALSVTDLINQALHLQPTPPMM